MKRRVRFRVLIAVMVVSLLASLTACGGGGGGGASGPVSGATVLSGTVAAGAPIIGIVGVKGANGATAQSTIDANGNFSLDVAALTANYILYAEGTVKGKTVKIYSVAVAPGTINITPITDLIVANALGAKPDDSLVASWTGSQVTATTLAAAKTTVQTAIAPLLTATGATAVDPMTGSFSADGTGLDKSLDYLKVDYTGSTATVTNLATGSTCTNNVSTNSSTALPAGDATATTAALTEEQAINVYWGKLTTLFATTPTYTQIETQLGPYIASDILDSGMNYTNYLSDWLQNGPTSVCTIKASIERPMATSEYNAGTYSKAYWTRVNYKCGTQTGSFVDSTVLSGTTWLEHGNRRWIKSEIQSMALADYRSTGIKRFTGFNFWLNDNYYYAYNLGVRSAVVTGAGLPQAGVKYDMVFPNTEFQMLVPLQMGDRMVVALAPFQDSAITAIPDNSVYTVKLYSVPSASLTGSNTPLSTFTEIIPKRPYTNAELQAGASTILPVFTAPTSYNLSAANVGGSLTVSWSNPSTMSVDGAVEMFGDYTNWQRFENQNLSSSVTTTSIITSSTTITNPTWASVELHGSDIYNRHIWTVWQFTPTGGWYTPTGSVSGAVTNNNADTTHNIMVGLCIDPAFTICVYGAGISPGNGGSYSIPNVQGGTYYVGTCVDANNNGWCDLSDPNGIYGTNPVIVTGSNVSAVNITIP